MSRPLQSKKKPAQIHTKILLKKTPIYFTPKYNPGVKILYLGQQSKTGVGCGKCGSIFDGLLSSQEGSSLLSRFLLLLFLCLLLLM